MTTETRQTMAEAFEKDTIDGADAVPGWKLPIAELFEG